MPHVLPADKDEISHDDRQRTQDPAPLGAEDAQRRCTGPASGAGGAASYSCNGSAIAWSKPTSVRPRRPRSRNWRVRRGRQILFRLVSNTPSPSAADLGALVPRRHRQRTFGIRFNTGYSAIAGFSNHIRL